MLPTEAWIVAAAIVATALLASLAAWKTATRRPRLSTFLHDASVSLLTGSVITVGFLAVSVTIDERRAGREAQRAESIALRQLLATEDNLPGLRLESGDLSQLYAPNKKLTDAYAIYVELRSANLSGSDLRRGQFFEADFSQSNMQGVNLDDAIMWDADLDFVDLRGASLVRTDLRRASLYRVDLRNADLTDARLEDVTYTNPTFGESLICYDETTLWPADYVPPLEADCSANSSSASPPPG